MVAWIKEHLGLLLVLGFFVFVCSFLLYSWVDSRITITYMSEGLKDQREQKEVLQSLLLVTSTRFSRSELKKIIAERFGEGYLIEEEQNEISVDNVILIFSNDSLVEVRSPEAG